MTGNTPGGWMSGEQQINLVVTFYLRHIAVEAMRTVTLTGRGSDEGPCRAFPLLTPQFLLLRWIPCVRDRAIVRRPALSFCEHGGHARSRWQQQSRQGT